MNSRLTSSGDGLVTGTTSSSVESCWAMPKLLTNTSGVSMQVSQHAMVEIYNATELPIGYLVAIWWHLVASLFLRKFRRILRKTVGSCEFNLGGQQAWLADSLAMFCGLASRLAQLLAPKHAVNRKQHWTCMPK